MSSKKTIKNILLTIFILSFLFSVINGQTYTNQSMEYSDVGGIGAGVFAIIVALVIGVIICIFGLSTVMPGVFFAIGVCLPTCIFLFFAFCPLKDPPGINDITKNLNKNVYIVWRWLYFAVMLACLIAVFVPLCILWNVMVIPQRVDSRAQKEYDERYKELLEKEMKMKDMEEKAKKEAEANALNNNNNNNVEPVASNFNTYQNPAINLPDQNEMNKKKLLRRKKK